LKLFLRLHSSHNSISARLAATHLSVLLHQGAEMSFLFKSSNSGTTEKGLSLEEQQEKVSAQYCLNISAGSLLLN
jgi:hypothetical protein